jgi:hypothetical protein
MHIHYHLDKAAVELGTLRGQQDKRTLLRKNACVSSLPTSVPQTIANDDMNACRFLQTKRTCAQIG